MNRKTQLGTAMRSALLTCAVAAAATLAAPAAFASVIGNTTGGVGCNQASGSGNLFYFTNLSAQNVTDTVQFLSCLYIDINRGVAPLDAEATNIQIINTTAAAANFTCVVQAGTEGGVLTSAVLARSQAANGSSFLFADSTTTTPRMPTRPDRFRPYTLSCSIPAGGKIGLINIFLPGNIGA